MNEKIYFKQIFGVEELHGYIEFDNEGYSEEIWYEDKNTGVYCNVCPPVSPLFTQAIAHMDLCAIAGQYDDEDENKCLVVNDVLIIINPNDFLDTLVNMTGIWADCPPYDTEPKKYSDKVNIRDLMCAVAEEHYDALHLVSANEVRFCKRGGFGEQFQVHFGDYELKHFFLEDVWNICEIFDDAGKKLTSRTIQFFEGDA